MSNPFTDWHTLSRKLQSLTLANEIVRAYNERRVAIGEPGTAPLYVVGNNAQDPNLWYQIQLWIENTVQITELLEGTRYFVNHLNLVKETGEDYWTFFRPWTWSTFCAAAGLGAGWRRARECDEDGNPVWLTPGKIQWDDPNPLIKNDMRGYWVYEDLQKALATLKWTNLYAVDGHGESQGMPVDGTATGNYDEATAKADADAQYDGASQVNDPAASPPQALSWYRGIGTPPYFVCGKWRLNAFRTVDFGELTASSLDIYGITKSHNPSEPFCDQGDGVLTENKLSYHATEAGGTGEREITVIPKWTLPPFWPAFGYTGTSVDVRGYYTIYTRYLAKWSFSNDEAP